MMLKRIANVYTRFFWSCEKLAISKGVMIGKDCDIQTRCFGSEPYLIEIGDNVQVTSGVKFFTHGAAWVFRKNHPKMDFFGKVKVGNNVYIGNNALILPGVTIKNNVIVAAGSVVTKNIPKDSIVGGNPAKIIGRVSELENRMLHYNVSTKGLSSEEKKKILSKLPEDKFIVK